MVNNNQWTKYLHIYSTYLPNLALLQKLNLYY